MTGSDRRRARRDAIVLAISMAVLLALAVHVEAFEALVDLVARFERYEVDELLSGLLILPGGLLVYIWRRGTDLRAEAARRLALQEQLEYQTLYDDLTGLANRRLLSDRTEQALRLSSRTGETTALLLFDLNRFKDVNDSLGHQAGDALLAAIGPRLAPLLRTADTMARLGVDEFAILLPQLPDPAAAATVAERVLDLFREPFTLSETSLVAEASIGIATCPDSADDVAGLFQQADVAMYAAKRSHLGYAFYSAEEDVFDRSKLVLLSELRRAMEDHELVIHYQPKLDLRQDSVTGVEALLRWQHPERGLLAPGTFLPAVEQTGLIGPLTRYVLEEALAQQRRWRDDGRQLSVAVNVSARNLVDPSLPDTVARLLEESGVPGSALELEITETAIMVDLTRASRTLDALRELGVDVSIDDYGTGFSSLASLRRLPVGQIKIDRSFVSGMLANDDDAVIVRSTIELGRHLGLRVVAEGVEDRETLDRLTGWGCDDAQGFYIGRPVPPEALCFDRADRVALGTG